MGEIRGDRYEYRIEQISPGVEWRDSWPEPRILHVPLGRASWACLTHEHRYHRTKEAAARCAGIILPRIERCEIVGGTLFLDPGLLAEVRGG